MKRITLVSTLAAILAVFAFSTVVLAGGGWQPYSFQASRGNPAPVTVQRGNELIVVVSNFDDGGFKKTVALNPYTEYRMSADVLASNVKAQKARVHPACANLGIRNQDVVANPLNGNFIHTPGKCGTTIGYVHVSRTYCSNAATAADMTAGVGNFDDMATGVTIIINVQNVPTGASCSYVNTDG